MLNLRDKKVWIPVAIFTVACAVVLVFLTFNYCGAGPNGAC
jgi:hypothetical protein